jgi:hypothetical protein
VLSATGGEPAVSDLGLEHDAERFVSLLKRMFSGAQDQLGVKHTYMQNTNHASICWEEATHQHIVDFILDLDSQHSSKVGAN